MTVLRVKGVYEFEQSELNSMMIVSFDFEKTNTPYSMVKEWNADESMLRLYGRFYQPLFGCEISMLKDIVEFSTIQSLLNAELYFLDELDDSKVLSIVDKIKSHLTRQNLDPLNEVNYPKAFIERVKIIKGNSFSLEDV